MALNFFCYELIMGEIEKFQDLPAHQKFLRLVTEKITPSDILFLSGLDYNTDIQEHADRITYFKQTLDTSKLDLWYPAEVWELNRWSCPGYLDTIGHSRRAFSCAGLMAYYFDRQESPVEFLDVLFPLFESLVRLNLLDWQEHFLSFLSYGLTRIKCPESKFCVQLTSYLTHLSETNNPNELRTGYNQLMVDEMCMLKHYWKHHWNKTWDPALEPKIDRPAKIIDTRLTHQTACQFAANFVYQKAQQVDGATISKNLETLAHRIAG